MERQEGAEAEAGPGAPEVVQLGVDLRFSDAQLEREFCAWYADEQRRGELALATGVRLVAWTAAVVRCSLAGDPRCSSLADRLWIWAPCVLSSVLPVLGQLCGRRAYLR